MTNERNTVLYTGVTNNIERRACEHSLKEGSWFTKKYNITKLVYCEEFHGIQEAIEREKQIKGGSRNKKLELVKSINPKWLNLSIIH